MICIDSLSLKYFIIIKLFVTDIIIPNISKNHIQLCKSSNNSKSINQYIENLTKMTILEYFKTKFSSSRVYCGLYCADSPIQLDDCVIHLDSKGVEIKKERKKYTITQMKKILEEKSINTSFIQRPKRRFEYEELFKQNNLNLKYETNKYIEFFDDNNDDNLHFKSSQTNLSGFVGNHKKNEVKFDGKLPCDIENPHLTFILKHVYNEDLGIIKFVLYSIPHNIYLPEYSDIQFEYKNNNPKKRTPKAIDEFRFNMNDSNNNPYKFKNSHENRYISFIVNKKCIIN